MHTARAPMASALRSEASSSPRGRCRPAVRGLAASIQSRNAHGAKVRTATIIPLRKPPREKASSNSSGEAGEEKKGEDQALKDAIAALTKERTAKACKD